ncbi:MAG TPA: hypothetical protein VLM78_00520 [Anaerolineales bacterium]|nr:hypothetical protein [Anaerolineales bacterium]
MKRTLWLVLASVFLAISLPLLVWGFWPPRRETVTLPLLPADGMPSLPEARTIHLTFSPVMRASDAQIVELNLSADGEAGDASLYEEYNVIVEARLDLPFADVRPAEVVSTALGEGSAATFYWEVNPREVGELRGTVWLYLRLVPKAGGEETRQPVSAQLIGIRSKSVLGRTGSQARAAGVVGLIVGLALGILSIRRWRDESRGTKI